MPSRLCPALTLAKPRILGGVRTRPVTGAQKPEARVQALVASAFPMGKLGDTRIAPDVARKLARAGRKRKLERDVGRSWRGHDESDDLSCDGSDEEIGRAIEQAFDGELAVHLAALDKLHRERTITDAEWRQKRERMIDECSQLSWRKLHACPCWRGGKFSCRHRGPRSAAAAEKTEERRNERRRLRQIELDRKSEDLRAY